MPPALQVASPDGRSHLRSAPYQRGGKGALKTPEVPDPRLAGVPRGDALVVLPETCQTPFLDKQSESETPASWSDVCETCLGCVDIDAFVYALGRKVPLLGWRRGGTDALLGT